MKTFISYFISGGALSSAVVSVFGSEWNISPDVTTLAGNVALAYGVLSIVIYSVLSVISGLLLVIWDKGDNTKTVERLKEFQNKYTLIRHSRMVVLWGVVCSHFIYQGWIITGVLHFITGLTLLTLYRKIVKLELPETETVIKS